MSIMDAFRNVFNGQQQGQGQVMPGNLPNQQPAMMQGSDGQVPNVAASMQSAPTQAEPTPPVSPLDQFSKLWEPSTTQTDANKGAVTFNIDPAKVTQAAQAIDFTKGLDPALLQKINQGGPEAMQAMLAVINQTAQQSFAQAAIANAKVLETGLAKQRENMSGEIPELVRKQTISSTIRQDNPIFANPATAPMLSMLETQLASKYPNATPQEISTHAKDYLAGFASMLTAPQQQQAQQAKTAGETDWAAFEKAVF